MAEVLALWSNRQQARMPSVREEGSMIINTPREGEKACPTCRGTGLASKYDMGWRSLGHNESLAVKTTCASCGGTGVVRV